MKLEITKERILEVASKCENAKETLKTLFPEVFEDEVVTNFKNRLATLIEWQADYERVYLKIPGSGSEDKAAHIIKLLGL